MSADPLPRSIHTVVVGAGQAGLAMSHYLTAAGREHVVLDRRATLGGSWQDRWDEFCLVSPNWTLRLLPGLDDAGDDPDGFMPRDEIVRTLVRYAAAISSPVRLETEVRRVRPVDGRGFVVETTAGTIRANEVVVASGGFPTPNVPAIARDLPARITQVHSHDYRTEAALPPGAVLVVGSGQSGVQLAEELEAAGRTVVLAVGHCGRAPRRYRGRDIFHWFVECQLRGEAFGAGLPTVDSLPDPRARFAGNPHLSGHGGGHDTNLREFARRGIRLVGRIEAVSGERLRLAPDLAANLRYADVFFAERFRPIIDRYVERSGVDAGPPDELPPLDFEPPAADELDLAAEGISTVLWTTGYRPDYAWIDAPILDEVGLPRHRRGVTTVPGLTFIGLLWQHTQGSHALFGVGSDAEYLANRW